MAIQNLDKWMKGKEHEKRLRRMYNYLLTKDKSKSIHSHSSYLRNMNFIFDNVSDVDFECLTEEDVETVLVKIVTTHSNDKTIANYYISFRKWLMLSKQEGLLVHVVVPKVTHDYENKKVISPEQLEMIIDAAKHPRDKAILALLWDSGCRVGELCAIKIKHIQFDDNGARVTLPVSKTQTRKLRVVFAASYLRVWLDNHNWKDNPDAPLFYSLRSKGGVMKDLSDEGVRRQIKLIGESLRPSMHLNPHIFRHSRASDIAENNIMSEMQMKKQFGWTNSSQMAAIYVHLADDSHEKAILKASGVEIDEPEKELAKPIRCHRCKELNSKDSDRCYKCGQALSEKAIREEESRQQDILERLEKLESVNQHRNALDMLIGAEYEDMETGEKRIMGEDNAAVKLLRKLVDELNTDLDTDD